jgi:hypothetical protein
MPHVSEEAAEVSRIMDKEKRCDGVPSTPELQQGTMVSEVCQQIFLVLGHWRSSGSAYWVELV